jgi:hypothetical protein
VGRSALSLLGTATRVTLNLTIALFGLYYLLLYPESAWQAARPYIPFSSESTERLRRRFRDVTNSTLIGTGLIAAVQGTLVERTIQRVLLGGCHRGALDPAGGWKWTDLGPCDTGARVR